MYKTVTFKCCGKKGLVSRIFVPVTLDIQFVMIAP